jgi:hypothetical protein
MKVVINPTHFLQPGQKFRSRSAGVFIALDIARCPRFEECSASAHETKENCTGYKAQISPNQTNILNWYCILDHWEMI